MFAQLFKKGNAIPDNFMDGFLLNSRKNLNLIQSFRKR